MLGETFTLINVDRPSEVNRFWKVGNKCIARPLVNYKVNGYRDINSNKVSYRLFQKYGCELVLFDEPVKSDVETEVPVIVEHLRENMIKADKMFKEFLEVCNEHVQGLETLSST